MTPFAGGRVRFSHTDDRYPNGRLIWRCAWCGRVGPWQDGWGGYWSALDEDDGLFADDKPGGYPVWCSPACCERVQVSGACSATSRPVRRKRR